MARTRNYHAEYLRRVQRHSDEAEALGIKITANQAVGHARKGQVNGADIANMYEVRFGRSDRKQQQALAKLRHKWGADKPQKQKPKRKDVPADIKKGLGEDWAPIFYGGSQ